MDAPGLIPPLIGAPLSPRSGGVAGIVEDLLVDEASHRPVWLLVRLRDSERPYTFVPAERMASRTGSVVVPFDEKALRETPVRFASPSPCAREHAATLSRHYGVRVPLGEARGLRAAPPAARRRRANGDAQQPGSARRGASHAQRHRRSGQREPAHLGDLARVDRERATG